MSPRRSETNDLANQMSSNYHPRNPRGQQRDKPYREALRMELAEMGVDLKKLREIARAHIEKAVAGDMQAIKELADRLDGKAVQLLEHAGGGEMRVIVTSGLVREQQIIEADYQEAETVPTKLIGTNGANGSNGHG
jgi:hypothetical protein